LKARKLIKKDVLIGVSCLSTLLSKEPEATCRRVMAYVMENIAKKMENTGKNKTKKEEMIQKLPDGNTLAVIKTWFYMENPDINSINKID
jgi:hypothetical protein